MANKVWQFDREVHGRQGDMKMPHLDATDLKTIQPNEMASPVATAIAESIATIHPPSPIVAWENLAQMILTNPVCVTAVLALTPGSYAQCACAVNLVQHARNMWCAQNGLSPTVIPPSTIQAAASHIISCCENTRPATKKARVRTKVVGSMAAP